MRWPLQPVRRVAELEGRLWFAEQERDTAVRRAEVAESAQLEADERVAAQVRAEGVRTKALMLITGWRVELSPLQVRGLLVDLPVDDDGRLDEAAFAEWVFDAAVELQQEIQAGRPH